MRLSEWRATAPHKDAGSPKVAAVVDPILAALGTGSDPHVWVAWGEEPWARFTILAPTDPGLIVCFVRVMVPGEGPRASGKLVRWNRVAIGELAIEAQQGHRLLSFQIEQQVLRGVDDEADRVAGFALRVIAAIDGRPLPDVVDSPRRRAAAGAAASSKGSRARNAAAARPAKTSGAAAGGNPPAAKAKATASRGR
ncbi:MAG TPA: hypothetical protein VFI34_02385 [Candidatus Limnocylindrales bacterium]|nr:hypothetical protein [Candidatus Limnocylindrales bacterium]